MPSSVNGLIGTYPATNPIFTGGYVYSRAQHAGVVAAFNHISLANPTGSGKVILVAGVFVSSVIVGAVPETVDPLRGYFATSVSGGTLQATSVIGKVKSTMPNPVAEVRIDGMTATLGAAWFNSPALFGSAKAPATLVHQIPAAIPAGSITLLPGEAIVLRTESGDLNQRWNMSIAWSEI